MHYQKWHQNKQTNKQTNKRNKTNKKPKYIDKVLKCCFFFLEINRCEANL